MTVEDESREMLEKAEETLEEAKALAGNTTDDGNAYGLYDPATDPDNYFPENARSKLRVRGDETDVAECDMTANRHSNDHLTNNPYNITPGWNHTPVTWSIEMPENDYDPKTVTRIATAAFKVWSDVCGIRFAKSHRDWDSADIPIRFQTEKDNPKFHKSPQVLGYAYFPIAKPGERGHITINDSYHWGPGGDLPTGFQFQPDEYMTKKSYVLLQVLAHEIGHAIGLPHNHTGCKDCIMAPYYNGQIHAQPDDIQRASLIYGRKQ